MIARRGRENRRPWRRLQGLVLHGLAEDVASGIEAPAVRARVDLADRDPQGLERRAEGQETTIASLFNVFVHWGAIVVPLGYTDEAIFTTGNPYGASSTGEPTEEELAVARYQGRRIAEKAEALARSRT